MGSTPARRNPTHTIETRLTGANVQRLKSAIGFRMIEAALDDPTFLKFVLDVMVTREVAATRDQPRIVAAITDWIDESITYVWETGERLQDPRVTLAIRLGDCDDFATLAIAAAMAVGLPGRYVWIKPKSELVSIDSWHVYAEIGVPTKAGTTWIPVDACMPEGQRGYDLPDDAIAERVTVDYAAASQVAMPNTLALKLSSAPTDIIQIEGGVAAAAGIRFLEADDLSLIDNAAGFADVMKKIGKGIKAVASKVVEVGKKVVNSPLVKAAATAAATAVGGPGAALAVNKAMDGIGAAFNVAERITKGDPKATAEIMDKVQSKLSAKIPALAPALAVVESTITKTQAKLADTPAGFTRDNKGNLIPVPVKVLQLGQSAIQGPAPILAQTPITSSPLMEAMAPVIASPERISEMQIKAQTPVPAVASTPIVRLSQNAQLLDSLARNASAVAPIVAALDPANAEALKSALAERQQAVTQATAEVGQKILTAISQPGRALTDAQKKAIETATDTDYLHAVNYGKLRDIKSQLDQSKSMQVPINEQVAGDYLKLKSRYLELAGQRESTIHFMRQQLMQSLPGSSESQPDRTDLGKGVTSNLSDHLAILLSAGQSSTELDAVMQISTLFSEETALNQAIDRVRRSIGA